MWGLSVFLKTLSFAILMVFCLQCAKSPIVTRGQGRLGVINFPDWFLHRNTERYQNVIIATGRFEARKASGSSPGELLFEAIDNDGESSVNFFAASLDGQFKARQSTAAEWERSESLPTKRADSLSNETKASLAGAQYRGKTYAKTGHSWESTIALPSPSGKWIVVFSHTSGKDNPSYGVLGGGGRGKGEMFIDVYDTASGEKMLAGHSPHVGGDQPSRHFANAFWVGERYLVVPLDSQDLSSDGTHGESCFLGILPEH